MRSLKSHRFCALFLQKSGLCLPISIDVVVVLLLLLLLLLLCVLTALGFRAVVESEENSRCCIHLPPNCLEML